MIVLGEHDPIPNGLTKARTAIFDEVTFHKGWPIQYCEWFPAERVYSDWAFALVSHVCPDRLTIRTTQNGYKDITPDDCAGERPKYKLFLPIIYCYKEGNE